MKFEVLVAEKDDLASIAGIYEKCFSRERNHGEWIKANFSAFPRMRYYLVIIDQVIVGYALWSVKSGFRDKSIVELEQLAVVPELRGRGVGKELLEQSFDQFKRHLHEKGIAVKAIYLTTRDGNSAEGLYRKVFGVEREGVIKNYGSGDEVILFKQFT